jgi:hypothetical protein
MTSNKIFKRRYRKQKSMFDSKVSSLKLSSAEKILFEKLESKPE